MHLRRAFALLALPLAQPACSSADGASGASTTHAGQDAAPADASVGPDARPDGPVQTDALADGIPLHEAAPPDHDLPDAVQPDVDDVLIDAVVSDVDTDSASEDGAEAQPESGPEPQAEAGPDATSWPVPVGVYTYSRIPTYGLVDPAAVAWHNDGSHALVLGGYDGVYLFDHAGSALTQVASVGAAIRWRDLTFTPDGTKAVLLGVDTSTSEGVLYLWDDATQTVQEMSGQRYAGGSYEALEYSPDGSTARLLGSRIGTGYVATVWTFDIENGRSSPLSTATSAGCQDIAWATDVYDHRALAIVCGDHGAELLHIDGGNHFVEHTHNAGNTSRVAGRPQGDYALAVCWSSSPGKVYRFAQGIWNSDYSNPAKPGIFQVEFSTDGLRALLLGGYGGNPAVGQVYEYRHDLFASSAITDVSIPDFGAPPYNADPSVELKDAAWRPGCDGGLIVGGSNTYSSKTGYVIRFRVDNGIACAD